MNTVKTSNEDYGFYGTVSHRVSKEVVEVFWDRAISMVSTFSKSEPEQCKAYLDSVYGRHFADSVIEEYEENGEDIDKALQFICRTLAHSANGYWLRKAGLPLGTSELKCLVHLANKGI